MRIRMETPTWFRRLIRQVSQVTVTPILRVFSGLNIRETVTILRGLGVKLTLTLRETVTTVLNVTRWVLTLDEILSLVEVFRVKLSNFISSVINISETWKAFAPLTRIPPADSITVFDRNGNVITTIDPSVLWDGNTATGITLYYDAGDPTKPYRIRFTWNNPQRIDYVTAFIQHGGYARFIVEKWDGSSYTVICNAEISSQRNGWFTHKIPDSYANQVTGLAIRVPSGTQHWCRYGEIKFAGAYNFLWHLCGEWTKLTEYAFATLNGVLVLFPKSVLTVAEAVNAVLNYTGSLISIAIQEAVGLIEAVGFTRKNFLTEVVTMIENVVANLSGGSGGGLQWDYSVAYDQQGQQISLDLSPLQDSNTSTSVSIYYTPSVPSNPRKFVVGWNEARWFQVISIHISGYTPSKQLIVTIKDSFGYSQVSVLSLTGTGWYYVYPDYYEIANIKEVEFAPDTSVLGYVSLSEVWFEEMLVG